MPTLNKAQRAKLLAKVEDQLSEQKGGTMLLSNGDFIAPNTPMYSTATMNAVACVQGDHTLTWIDGCEDDEDPDDDDTGIKDEDD